jgi:hypothetical protein
MTTTQTTNTQTVAPQVAALIRYAVRHGNELMNVRAHKAARFGWNGAATPIHGATLSATAFYGVSR